MRDVAAVAGVALKTVSRVMNGEAGVRPDVVSRVFEAADKLGYRPNLIASSLRRGDGRTATIGMLVQDVSNPFSAELLRAVEDATRDRGVQLLIASIDDDSERERAVARSLIDRAVDGLVIVPTGGDQSYLHSEQSRGTHVVFLDRRPQQFAGDVVTSDNLGGALQAMRPLIDRGHRRIAYLGDSIAISTMTDRFRGYTDTLADADIRLDLALVAHGLRSIDAAYGATRDLLSSPEPPSALFTSQNLVTCGAVKALHELGLQHEVALVGFDDVQNAEVYDPGISTVVQDVGELGRVATERLFSRVSGDTSGAAEHTVPTRLIQRGSGEIGRAAARAAG